MAYSRVNWQDDKTPLSAKNMNHMDEAIYNLSSAIDSVFVGGKIIGTAIQDNSLPGTKIVINSISGDRLEEGAVTDSKIHDGAVITEKIQNYAVTTEKLATNSVTTEKISNNSITTEKIVQGAVTNDKIANNTITNNKLSSYSIPAGKVLVADGNGNVVWQDINIPENVVQRVVFNGTTYEGVNGTATFNQVQPDFNETNVYSPAYIKNKPGGTNVPAPSQADAGKLLYVGNDGNYTIGNPPEFNFRHWKIMESDTSGFIIKWVS